MKIITRLRDALRRFLGLDDLPSLTMFKAMEQKQRERHEELADYLGEIERKQISQYETLLGAIEGLTKTLQMAHVVKPRISFEYQDFDSAQIAAMIAMQDNPERDN